ncbi:MAG: hypothetical protein ACREQA_16550 [Candidatus Binatia bacterium]
MFSKTKAIRKGLTGLGLLWLMAATLVSCVTTPAPIVIYEDRRDSIWLKFDPEAGTGHSHPYSMTSEQMAKILRGVWVKHREVIAGFGLLGEGEGAPAFSGSEIAILTPYLAEALRKASPKDMVTFYVTRGDPTLGQLVTSGGLFVQDNRMYFILANSHTSPSSVQYENTYEFEARDEPLIPIARHKFTVGFSPKEAWIPNAAVRGKEGYERYLDESKLLVLDLPRLMTETQTPTTKFTPTSPKPGP